jgi:cold shock CspA family protein
MSRRSEGTRRGVVAEVVADAGFGVIEPDDHGGQLPMRAVSVDCDRDLLAGDAVEYSLAAGSLGVEAVGVKSLDA